MNAGKMAVDDTRVVVNLDFSIVVPAGVTYTAENAEAGGEYVLTFSGEGKKLTLRTPKVVGHKMNFADPVAKGVIRNFTAGMIRLAYGHEERQSVVVERPHLIALTAVKSDQNKKITFAIGAEKGLYEGSVRAPGKNDRERVAWVKAMLETIAEYTPDASEEAAAREQMKVANQKMQETNQEESERMQETETVSRVQADVQGAADDKTIENENAKALTEADQNGAANDNNAAEAVAAQAADGAEAQESAGEASEVENAAETDTPTEAVNDETAEEEIPAEMTELEKLEQKRREKLEEMKRLYHGNPDVEVQIDNYIARTERMADRISGEFHSYLEKIQDYAMHTRFVDEEDPNYLAMLDEIQEAENALGAQLDEIVYHADENAENARSAGIAEAYVERLIRMMDRLDRRYDDLCVTLNRLDYLAYTRPEDLEDIFYRWQEVRFSLPTYIEQAEKETEQRVSNEIRARIDDARARINADQQGLADGELQLASYAEAIQAKEQALAMFEEEYEQRRQKIVQERDARIATASDQVRKMEKVLTDEQDELVTLNQELSHTFSLNVNRKKELNSAIADANEEIDQIKNDLAIMRDKKQAIREEYDIHLADLEDNRKAMQDDLDAARQGQQDLQDSMVAMQQEIETLHQVIDESEEEWKHLHENFLLGKYDEQD